VTGYAADAAAAAKSTSSTSKSSTKKTTKKSRRRYSPWRTPNYADSTDGDVTAGEDPIVRQAALAGLGRYNGSVVVVDTDTGRILSIVNQKLAFQSGFIPCSTIKIPVALAALSEGIIDRTTKLRIYGTTRVDMTEALARSNNQYFENLGLKLGFQRVNYYAKLLGLGEKAGLNIPEEQPGKLPAEPPKNGVGKMCSFGEGFTVTPLQLASVLSVVSNGGTLYYLQYPRNQEEVSRFVPQVKRRLDMQQWIPEVKPGMMGAVAFGTARRIGFDPNEPILGKTGTCTDYDARAHLGWFGAFNDTGSNRLAVVVMLTGGSAVNGPVASGVAGKVFKELSAAGYLNENLGYSPVALMQTSPCCAAP
jgi:cell division protein FtsI/penicillin-binding protein 2